MVSRFGPKDFAACGRCGSGQVHPKLLVMGPIAGIDSDSRTFVCHACGHEGLPIFFDTQEARAQFEREKKGLWDTEPKAAKKGVLTIPILPIQTDPLIALKILEHLPVRVATVTGVRWEDGQLSPTAYRASYQEYWDAIGGPRYNATCLFDLRRFGTELGPDPALLASLEGLDLELYIGGGLQESDVLRLGESGFAGGLVDPYTPVIRDLLAKAPKAPTTTEASAPAPAPRTTSAPGSVPSSGGVHVRP